MRHVFGVVTRSTYIGLSRSPGDRRDAKRPGGSKGREGHIIRHDYVHIFFKLLFDHLGDLCHSYLTRTAQPRLVINLFLPTVLDNIKIAGIATAAIIIISNTKINKIVRFIISTYVLVRKYIGYLF